VGAKQLILDIIARDKTKQGLTSATRNVGGMGKAVRGVGTGLAAIGLAAFAKESVTTFQNVTKETLGLNRATGGTVEATSRLRFAATQSGQDIGNFTKAMGLLDKGLVKAAQTGKGPTAEAMKQLGVGFTDATGKVKPLTETLPLMAEKFKGMENGPTKTALALQLFGKQGAALLPFLNKGASGIEELMGKTDEFNQVVGTEQVEAYKKNIEAQKKFDAAMVGIKMTLGESLLPAITPVIEKVGDLAKFFGDLPQPVQTTAVAVTAAAVAFNALSGPLGLAKAGLMGLGGMFTTTATGAAAVGSSAAPAAAGLGVLSAGALATSAAILGGGYAFHQWIQGAQRATDGADGLTQAAALSGGALTDQSRAAADAWLGSNDLGASYRNLKLDADTVRSAILGNSSAMDQVKAAIGNAAASQQQFTSTGAGASAMMTAQGNTLSVLSDKLLGAFEGTKQYAEAAAKLRDEQQKLAEQDLSAKLSKVAEAFTLGSVNAATFARDLAASGRAAGKTDADISAMLKTVGATPHQIKVALSADPTKLHADLAASQVKLNELKQYKKPEIRAEVAGLQRDLDSANSELNSLLQKKKPNLDAVDRISEKARTIQARMDAVKQKHAAKIEADVRSAQIGLGATIGLIAQVKSKTVRIDVQEHWTKFKAGGGVFNSATGGERAGLAIVGERGPELVYLPEGSEVKTASQTRSLLPREHFATGRRGKLSKADRKKQLEDRRSKAIEQRDAASSILADAIGARDSSTTSTKETSRSFFGLAGYDVGAAGDARAELQSAQSELNSTAVGSSARASALSRVSAAQEKVSSTPASAGEWVRKRLDKMKRWRSALGKLSGVWGGSPWGQQLMRDVFEKGPDGGTELAEQLASNPSELSSLMNSYAEGDSIGGAVAGYHPDVINANATIGTSSRQVEQLQTVILQLDGQILHKSLLKIKRSAGGRPLGLA